MVKIMDDYLIGEEYNNLKASLESDLFPWYYNNQIVEEKNKLFYYQFVHIFYKDNNINSNSFNIVEPLIKKLKPYSLIRIKANLNPITHELIKSENHTDQRFKCKIAIYYVNNNNGYTMIENKKVESKGNRMVLFNSDKKHYGTNSTNCNNRMVINFNYF
tara:strand:- start:365 stop:844 length:480 start_codon:yes stop_codon:yes gene_type:complete